MTQSPIAPLMPYVAALARAVELLARSAVGDEPEKGALRALVAVAAERSATFRFYDGTLTIDGIPVPTADARLAVFAKRVAAQHLAEIVIAKGAEPQELLALASGLAANPGQGRIKERLRDASSSRVMVVGHQQVDASHRATSVTGAFAKVKMDEAVLSEWNKFLSHGATDQQDNEVELGFKAQATGEIQISMDPQAQRSAAPPPDPKVVPQAPPPSPPLSQPATLAAASPMGVNLAKVLMEPYGADALSKLTQLARFIEDGFTKDATAEAIDAVNALVELEQKAPNQQVRSTYGVILGRILTRTALAKVAPYLLEQRRRDRARLVLRRGGEAALGLLVQLIVDARSLGERTMYYDVLREIPQGTDRFLSLLTSRAEWQQTRNVVELAGEARIEPSVAYLARYLDHEDDRVRRAALVAMARIGSAATVEPLRNVLKTGAPELRSMVAASIGGAHARPLTSVLASCAETEDNADVARALVKAIGRIGTPEAKQALEKAATQKSLFSFRGKAVREAAEEALKAFAAAPSK